MVFGRCEYPQEAVIKNRAQTALIEPGRFMFSEHRPQAAIAESENGPKIL